MPCSAAKRIALVIRSSIFSRETPIASSFRSEIGDSITEKRTPSSTSASRSAGTAREKPQISASQPGAGDQPDRLPVVGRDAREARLDPVDPELVEQARDLELLLRVEDDADRLLAVAQGRVVEPDAAAERGSGSFSDAGPDQLAHHAATTPSGNEESFSAPSRVIRKLSSTRRPPPPSQ